MFRIRCDQTANGVIDMILFHVSEEPNIQVFHPRTPTRTDLNPEIPLVWALDEKRLPNFLTPRNCPRVTYHAGEQTTEADRIRFFSNPDVPHVVAIENAWFETMKNTTLYLYAFDSADFVLQDPIAGYYISEKTQTPLSVTPCRDLFEELFRRNVEFRLLKNLWPLADAVQASTLNWSFCRMKNAQSRIIPEASPFSF